MDRQVDRKAERPTERQVDRQIERVLAVEENWRARGALRRAAWRDELQLVVPLIRQASSLLSAPPELISQSVTHSRVRKQRGRERGREGDRHIRWMCVRLPRSAGKEGAPFCRPGLESSGGRERSVLHRPYSSQPQTALVLGWMNGWRGGKCDTRTRPSLGRRGLDVSGGASCAVALTDADRPPFAAEKEGVGYSFSHAVIPPSSSLQYMSWTMRKRGVGWRIDGKV